MNFGCFVLCVFFFHSHIHFRISCCMRCLLRFAVFDARMDILNECFHRMGDNYYYFFGPMKTIKYYCYLFSIQMICNRIESTKKIQSTTNENNIANPTLVCIQFIGIIFFSHFKLLRVSNCCHIIILRYMRENENVTLLISYFIK